VKGKEKIKSIQISGQDGSLIHDCSKGFSFLTRTVNGKQVDDVLMIRGRDFPDLQQGDDADIIITKRDGSRVKYYCKVQFCSSRQLRVIISAARAKNLEDQRRFYRTKAAINCRIVDVTRGENVNSYSPHLYGKIYDINIGGIALTIESEEKYQLQDLISFTAILNNQKFEASARILRLQKSDEGEITGYRCAFAAITPRQEDMISSYVNRLQLEERRVELELEKLEKDSRA
jgi:c-di-GMP-binding flagellar brake protein YcgR